MGAGPVPNNTNVAFWCTFYPRIGLEDTAMRKNLFIVSLDEFNHSVLRRVENYEELEIRPVLSMEETVESDTLSFNELLDKAKRQLREFEGRIDGIMGWWDFPTTCLMPALCQEFGLPSNSLKSVLQCEHKYWARLVQAEAAPDCVPGFCPVDPFADDPRSQVTLEFPFWLKPIKGMSSHLAFRIDSEEGFNEAIGEIRERIGRLGDPFAEALQRVDLPPEIAAAGGNLCIAEEVISGRQCTVEGYVYQGKVYIYAVIDTNKKPYYSYQYPSTLPEQVIERLHNATNQVMKYIEYNNATFNIEFFWDEQSDDLRILELNPRLSQSHADIFAMVFGVPNFQIMVDLALGREPHWLNREGPARCATKFFVTRSGDALVTEVPDAETVRAIEAKYPHTDINLRVEAGTVLSELPLQEAHGHELAEVFVGGDDPQEVLRRFEAVLEELPFRFETSPHDKESSASAQ